MDIYNASSDILKNMHTELKNICFDLMPQTLLKHGLEAALMEFAQRINASAEKHVDVHVHGLNSRLSELQEISLYRVTQEWVNNILKYSDARRITVQITRDETELTLIIEDDGMGFDVHVLKQGKGNGWRNIQARANLISGQIDVDTQPAMRGTSFILNANMLTTLVNRRAFLEAQTRLEA
jgi:signal transduction histidine kinase